MRPRDFIRRVGFGLRPDEKLPPDPLAWARAQFDKVPALTWPGRIYSEAEMLDIRIGFVDAEDKIDNEIKNPAEAKEKRRALYYRTGRRFFESYELAIRHHQAVYGEAPVFERFWHFWGNHFTIVDKNKLAVFNTGPMQRDVIRKGMTGRFADLVYDVTLSWPMMKSLDNFRSRGPSSKHNLYRKQKGKPPQGLNENHARELLELHTVSPACGYTQEDVINAANIMTGWGFVRKGKKRKHVEDREVGYTGNVHEPGTHLVMGQKFKPKGFDAKTKGKKQLRDLVEFLSSHESCRRFISWKLCRHFICDDPTDEMVQIVVDAWEKSDGMLPDIHRAVIEAAWTFGDKQRKFQMPETWFLQVARMSGAPWPGDPKAFEYDFKSKPGPIQRRPERILAELGHRPFRAQQPNGFPDTEAEWLSPEYLVRRLSLINNAYRFDLWTNDMDVKGHVEKVMRQNFDNPEALLAFHKGLGEDAAAADRLVALFCSERMLKA